MNYGELVAMKAEIVKEMKELQKQLDDVDKELESGCNGRNRRKNG